MPNLETRVQRLEDRTNVSERGPVSRAFAYFTEIVNSRSDLKDGELLGVRVQRDGENQHFPRLPGESEKACCARIKAEHGARQRSRFEQ